MFFENNFDAVALIISGISCILEIIIVFLLN